MAKSNNTADKSSVPTAVKGSGAGLAVASKPGSVQALPPSPTEVQQDSSSFLDAFAELVDAKVDEGGVVDDTRRADAEVSSAKAVSKPDASASEEVVSSEDEDAPLLTDEEVDADDADDDEDAEGADDAQVKGTLQKLYKAREAKRKLREQLAETETRARDLERKLSEVTQAAVMPSFEGFFAKVKSLEDLERHEQWLTSRAEYLEDHAEGFTESDDAVGGEVERDPAWIKQQRRSVLHELRRVPKLREALEGARKREEASGEKARKRYPFVFDASSQHHGVVLDLMKEHPELQSIPDKSLLLGRLALAKLVESGLYAVVPKGKVKQAEKSVKPEPARKGSSVSDASVKERGGAGGASVTASSASSSGAVAREARALPVLSSRSRDAEAFFAELVGG